MDAGAQIISEVAGRIRLVFVSSIEVSEMTDYLKASLKGSVEQAYTDGYNFHGNLGLGLEKFALHIVLVVMRHLGSDVRHDVATSFIMRLHTSDLYLSTACAQHEEAAWNRFTTVYQKYINHISLSVSPNSDAAIELADSVLADIFLPDHSGRSRISSYDGRSSLATWLRVIINNRAINERKRKSNNTVQIDSTQEMANNTCVQSIEATIRAKQYEHMIRDSFRSACNGLSKHERLVLLLRYEEKLQLSQIANLFGIHPSTIKRQLDRIQERLRKDIISILTLKYHLGLSAVEECLADIGENPYHSILNFIKQDF